MKLLMTYDYGQEAMTAIKELGYDVLYIKESELEKADVALDDVEVMVCYHPFGSLRLTEMTSLKYILLSSIGIDQLPSEDVIRQKIIVTNNKGGYSKPMGEWIVWSLLSGFKNCDYFFEQSRKHQWKLTTDVLEMTGKTIGFLGTGTIAQEASKRLLGFEVKRIGMNTTGSPNPEFDEVLSTEDKLELAARCDAVVVVLPHTSKTTNFVDKAFLSAMKNDAVLINVSRGAVLDESALLNELNQGKFRSVHLDVFETEPLPPDHPFWSTDRLHITPHNSWISEKRNSRRFDLIYENLKLLSKGEELLNVVDVIRGY